MSQSPLPQDETSAVGTGAEGSPSSLTARTQASRAAGDRTLGHVCFVSDFRYVQARFNDLAPILLDPATGWLHKLVGNASGGTPEGGGEASSVVVRMGLAGNRSRNPVRVTAGTPRPRGRTIVVPITWSPLKHTHLLPELDADLELSYVADEACRIGLSGRYRVPLGMVGERLDQVALHRVAESSVRSFLYRVHLALVEAHGKPGPSRDGDGLSGGPSTPAVVP